MKYVVLIYSNPATWAALWNAGEKQSNPHRKGTDMSTKSVADKVTSKDGTTIAALAPLLREFFAA